MIAERRPSSAARRALVVAGLAAFLGTGCPKNDDEQWARFNSNDFVRVEVGAAELGDPVTTELTSTTGAVVVGTGTVDPGAGPVGTEHQVLVEVFDDWQEIVELATVRVDSGDRGAEEFELVRDSADHGLWSVTVESVGADDEQRTDRFAFRLWIPDEDGGATDTGDD